MNNNVNFKCIGFCIRKKFKFVLLVFVGLFLYIFLCLFVCGRFFFGKDLIKYKIKI